MALASCAGGSGDGTPVPRMRGEMPFRRAQWRWAVGRHSWDQIFEAWEPSPDFLVVKLLVISSCRSPITGMVTQTSQKGHKDFWKEFCFLGSWKRSVVGSI